MKKKNSVLKLLIFFSIAAFLWKCKVPYYPSVNPQKNHFLVVEGFVRSDSATVVKLSYTRVVSQYDSARSIPETGAKVMVEDDHSDSYLLKDNGGGVYTMDPIFMDSSFKYRLHIFTKTGKEYASDFVPFKESPPIDSIDWSPRFDGVEIYVNTHNPQNNSRYYRFKYIETWEFHSRYLSDYIYDGQVIRERLPSEQVHVCWKSDTLKNINIATTESNSEDILHHQPLVFIPDHDIKLSVLYSIYVSQYAMDSSSYIFWQKMENNTEKTGSIFDPKPEELTGNVHCITDTSEKIIGFIGAGTVSHERIFIKNNLLPGWNLPNDCSPILITPANVDMWTKASYYISTKVDGGYSGYYLDCANCSVKGSTQKPPFWP